MTIIEHIAGLLNAILWRFYMYEIGSGIRVYFENKKEFRNVVFFPDDRYTISYQSILGYRDTVKKWRRKMKKRQ